MQTEGHWLRIDPGARRPWPRRTRTGRTRRRVGFAAAVIGISVVIGVGTLLVGATPDPARSTEPPRPVAPPEAASTIPAPPVDLAASLERWGQEYGVPGALLEALTWHESRWQPHVVSHAGAIGVGQLMPATASAVAASIGKELDAWDPDDNVRMAAHLLGTLLASSGQDERVALAGYAQGAWSVQEHGMTATTRQYVDEIIARYEVIDAIR